MNLKLLFQAFTLMSCMLINVKAQRQPHLVFSDSISMDLISDGDPDFYMQKLGLAINQKKSNLLNVVYMNHGVDSLLIYLYEVNKKRTYLLAKHVVETANWLDSEPYVQTKINQVFFDGNLLSIHYGKYLTKVLLSEDYKEVLMHEHFNIKASLGNSFSFLFPINDQVDSFFGILPNYFPVCPLVNENGVIVRKVLRDKHAFVVSSTDSVLKEYNVNLWSDFGYHPFTHNQLGLYVFHPNNNEVFFRHQSGGEWAKTELLNFEHLRNDRRCIDSIIFEFNSGRNKDFYSGCRPRNYYYRGIFANETHLYYLRNRMELKTSTYFLDEFEIVNNKQLKYNSSINLSEITFPDAPDILNTWINKDWRLTPLIGNDQLFARVVQLIRKKESQLLLEIYVR